MKIIYSTLLFVFAFSTISGQDMLKQTLGIQGSSEFINANNKSYFIQQSIGQASVIGTYSANQNQLRQGFLQPIKAALINGGFDTNLEAYVYPNPFQESVKLDFEEPTIDLITISLYHITGQLIYQEIFDPIDSLSLQFNHLASGAYILRGQMRAQSFSIKLIKH